jgi:hypothetical protein
VKIHSFLLAFVAAQATLAGAEVPSRNAHVHLARPFRRREQAESLEWRRDARCGER